jgi:hypothetical protein
MDRRSFSEEKVSGKKVKKVNNKFSQSSTVPTYASKIKYLEDYADFKAIQEKRSDGEFEKPKSSFSPRKLLSNPVKYS